MTQAHRGPDQPLSFWSALLVELGRSWQTMVTILALWFAIASIPGITDTGLTVSLILLLILQWEMQP